MTPRVLMVDDECCHRVLAEQGYEVSSAASGEGEALLPGIDGSVPVWRLR